MHAATLANGDDGVDGRPGLVTELLPRCMPHTKCHYERRFFSFTALLPACLKP